MRDFPVKVMLNKFKKRLLLLALTAATGCSTFGLTMAYMSDRNVIRNVITVGDVAINLTETKWNPDSGINILPRTTVDKNPQVVNTGSLDAWIFLKVKSPKKNIVTVDNTTKKKNSAANVELFSFQPNGTWELVSTTEKADSVEYVYGYKTLVKPNGTTQSLFDTITMVNYLEGSINPTEKLDIPIEAMAVQWNVDTENTNLKTIYNHYLKQKADDEKGGFQ